MRPLYYTAEESATAHREWKANCGPHSIAAACGLSLEQVRAALPNFRGWMNPTMVEQTLRNLGHGYRLTKGLRTQQLCDGINRLQWEGPWLDAGVPKRVAYRHTHFVAHIAGFVLCTACYHAEWVPVQIWRSHVAAEMAPFHITHHFAIELLTSKLAAGKRAPSGERMLALIPKGAARDGTIARGTPQPMGKSMTVAPASISKP